MKILLLIDSLGPGGAQRQMVNLAIGLASKGEKTDLLTYHKDQHYGALLTKQNITTLHIQKKNRYDLGVFIKVLGTLRKGRYDLCCSFLSTPNFYLLATKFFYPGMLRVVSERTCEKLISKFDRIVTRRLYSVAADAITVNSEHHYKFLRNKESALTSKLRNIPNGVDSSLFSLKTRSSDRKVLSLIGIGKVSPLKNPEVVIKALRILRDEMSIIVNFRWLGPLYEWVESQKSHFDYCRHLIEKFELEDQWEWLGKKKDINRFLANSDLLIHPSNGEGFPNVICEALMTGTPVIASRVYDHPNIIQENVTGFLFDPSSASELAGKIQKFHQLSGDDKDQMKNNARNLALSRFSNQIMVDSYWRLFNQLLAEKTS